MDGLHGESRQVRDWFPENVSGCFRLSKNEALNDLDMIHANIARNEIRTRHEIEKPTKRARLVDKLAHELATHTLMRSEHYTIRAGLDQIRADIAGYRDAIAQSRKNMLFTQREHDALAHTYASVREDFALALDLNAQLRAQVETTTRVLHAQLDDSHKERMEADDALTQLRNDHEHKLQLEAELISLRDRLQSSLNQQTLFEALLTKYREVVGGSGQNTQDIESSVMGPPVLELDMAQAEAEGVADDAYQQLELQARLDEHRSNPTSDDSLEGISSSSSSSSSTDVVTKQEVGEKTDTVPQVNGTEEKIEEENQMLDSTLNTGSTENDGKAPVKTELPDKSLKKAGDTLNNGEDAMVTGVSDPVAPISEEANVPNAGDESKAQLSPSTENSIDVDHEKIAAKAKAAVDKIQPDKVSLDPLLLLIRLRAAQEAELQMQANCRELEVRLLTSAQEAELRDQRVSLLSNALAKAAQDLELERSELLQVRSALRDEQLISKNLRQDLEAAARSRRRLLDELGSEEAKYRAVVDCLGTADARATDAEDSLREVIHEIRVLRNAVTSLQDSYDRVLNERHIAVKQLNDVTLKYQTLQTACKRLTQQQQQSLSDQMASSSTTTAVTPTASGTSWLEVALDSSASGVPGTLMDDTGTNDTLQLKARLARYAALNRALQAELRAQEDVKRASQKEVRRLHKQLSSAMGGKLGEQIDLLERVEPRARDIALRRGVLAVMQKQEQLAHQQQQQELYHQQLILQQQQEHELQQQQIFEQQQQQQANQENETKGAEMQIVGNSETHNEQNLVSELAGDNIVTKTEE